MQKSSLLYTNFNSWYKLFFYWEPFIHQKVWAKTFASDSTTVHLPPTLHSTKEHNPPTKNLAHVNSDAIKAGWLSHSDPYIDQRNGRMHNVDRKVTGHDPSEMMRRRGWTKHRCCLSTAHVQRGILILFLHQILQCGGVLWPSRPRQDFWCLTVMSINFVVP